MSGSMPNDPMSTSLNNAAAHDSGLYDPTVHDNQIVALYETRAQATAAADTLTTAGIDPSTVQVMDREADTMAGGVDYEAGNQGLWGAVKSLFMPDDDAHAYRHAIGAGHAMVVVTPQAASGRSHIIDLLESTDPIDFDSKLQEWRQAGYAGMASTAAAGSGTMAAVPVATISVTRPAALPVASGVAGRDDETIKVMEERLRVGKREVPTGAVRVRSYVVERPVEEQVRLHEERIMVERHPVDRAVTADDATAFQERTIEARATSDEPVVSKETRIVEEIGLRKEASDRTETVRDTVRHTEVEIDDGTTGTSNKGADHGTMGTGGTTTNSTAGATSSGTNAPRK